MNDTLNFKTEEGLTFSFAFANDDRELCELYEHETFSEWKRLLYQKLFPAYEHLIDLTPSFGYFSINAARLNKQLKVGLFQENTEKNRFLRENISANGIDNSCYLPEETINEALRENDFNIEKTLVRTRSMLKLAKYLRGVNTQSPLPSLLIEELTSSEAYQILVDKLLEINYKFFSYCPVTETLTEFSFTNSDIENPDIIFCFDEHKIKPLITLGLITVTNEANPPPEIAPALWKTVLFQYPFSKGFLNDWKGASPLASTYLQALNLCIYAITHENKENRLKHFLKSYHLLKTLAPGELSFSQLLTATRITFDLGYKKECSQYLQILIDKFQNADSISFDLPFLPPLKRYEKIDTQDDIAKWCLAAILETHELNRSDSCFNMQANDYELLGLYISLPQAMNKLIIRHEVYKAIHCPEDEVQANEETSITACIAEPISQTIHKKPEIAIIYHMARTGGTLISKCIACIQGNILLSEIHPAISVSSPITQAQEWFELFNKEEIEQYTRHVDYAESIQLIQAKVKQQNKHLIIRDWSHIDFTGDPFVDRCSYRLTQTETLLPHFTINQIATVRHPVDSYLSLSKLPVMQGKLDIKHYLEGAKEFALKAREIGFVRYENFCKSPASALKTICDQLKINYQEDFLDNFYEYTKITGDTNNINTQKTPIKASLATKVDEAIAKQFLDNQNYWKVLELLDYENYLTIL